MKDFKNALMPLIDYLGVWRKILSDITQLCLFGKKNLIVYNIRFHEPTIWHMTHWDIDIKYCYNQILTLESASGMMLSFPLICLMSKLYSWTNGTLPEWLQILAFH